MEWAYAANETVKVGVNTNALDAILGASWVVQLTLLCLIALSLWSWAIIFGKRKQFQQAKERDERFLEVLWNAKSLDEVYDNIADFPNSPVAQVYKSGFKELKKIAETKGDNKNSVPKLSGLDNVARALRKATDTEIAALERQLTVLATTGSTSPFIGLFGTVWGIMNAFQMIGATGAASLAVVAPGISEALIATAVGLFAAIPAVVAYNHFVSRLKKEELEISNFTSDFLNIVKRNFFKEE
jgi:biopolymer transport protein TolQ